MRFIHGDCLEEMKKLESESIDLVVTSPPYNLNTSKRKSPKGGHWNQDLVVNGYENYNDDLPNDEYVKWQRECIKEMYRLIKEDGAIFYNHKWRIQKGLLNDRHDIIDGFPVRQIIIWQRKGGINFNVGYFLPTYEVIYMITKPKFKLLPKKNHSGDVWKIEQERHNPHPAPFPVELPAKIIDSTNAELILDPFMGSGTTAIASLMFNRNFIGIDKSKVYVEMAKERVKEFKGGETK